MAFTMLRYFLIIRVNSLFFFICLSIRLRRYGTWGVLSVEFSVVVDLLYDRSDETLESLLDCDEGSVSIKDSLECGGNGGVTCCVSCKSFSTATFSDVSDIKCTGKCPSNVCVKFVFKDTVWGFSKFHNGFDTVRFNCGCGDDVSSDTVAFVSCGYGGTFNGDTATDSFSGCGVLYIKLGSSGCIGFINENM